MPVLLPCPVELPRPGATLLLIKIARITPSYVAVFKAVRLGALRDAPQAFGSTYARESQFDDSDWLARLDRMNSDSGVGFLAFDDETACGIVAAFLDENDPTRAHLVSMWTAPAHRQQGVGRLLVNQVFDWAQSRNARVVVLMVTSNNLPAIRFYERMGFMKTGRTEPYPNDPAILEFEMSRPVAQAREKRNRRRRRVHET